MPLHIAVVFVLGRKIMLAIAAELPDAICIRVP